MTAPFDVLPGLEVPVGEISAALARLWEGEPGEGLRAPSEYRASQMNLVLHLGLPTPADDALAQFGAALRFTQRYPARILVLCPRAEGGSDLAMRAKIYSECFLGHAREAMSCIEAVVLSYPQERREFLEDQVSIIVETDLPIYYWVHRLSQVHKIATYQWLLGHSKRFLLDTAVSAEAALTFAWPHPFRDLAQARLLPVRQSIGQFLSAYRPELIARGFQGLAVAHAAPFAAEGRVLLEWARARLQACGAQVMDGELRAVPPGATSSLELSFACDDHRRFQWRADFAQGAAYFESTLDGARKMLPMTTRLLPTEAALGEAIFF